MSGKMMTVWDSIKSYMNIEPDPDTARFENHKAVKLILLVGLLIALQRAGMEKLLFGKSSTESVIGCGIFAFFLAFSYVNWPFLRKTITGTMEAVILAILILVAFADYYPGVKVSAFLFLIILVVLPPMIFEKPWKLLLIVLAAGIFAFIFNLGVEDEFVRNHNIIRIVCVTFLSAVFTSYFSHARIRSVHMTQSKQVEAEHDPLTGILNRGGGAMMIRGCVERHESGTFLIVDIDDFKLVNDHYGHQKGDDILKEVARTLQSSFKKTDIVMRMGGDEFIIYAIGMVDYAVSCKRLEQLNERIRSIIISKADGSYVTVSIGGAINDGSYPTYEDLYKAADQYLYQTKAKGKDGYSLLGKSFR
jgi:diguanylate cyclase (GGDEF)-like protein